MYFVKLETNILLRHALVSFDMFPCRPECCGCLLIKSWGFSKQELVSLSISRTKISDIICRAMMEGGTDAEPTSDDKPEDSISGAGRTFDLVKDVLESVICL